MATSESDLKSEFRKDLKAAYGDGFVFTNNDMFRAGLPDFTVLWDSSFYGIEAKFLKALPKRGTSQCLKHEVSKSQIEFIMNARRTGNYGAILVGMPDVAVLMLDVKPNYTLDELLAAPRIDRAHGAWQVKGMLEKIRGYP